MRRIDAHQHFWRLTRGDYGWLTPSLGSIHRDFEPADLEPLLVASGIAGTVLVQAAATEAETHFMLSLADEHDFIEGVVGWVDFEAPDAPSRIAGLAAHNKLKGLRPMIQDIADDRWMLRSDIAPAISAMVEHDLVFDALVLPRHLDHLLELLKRHPELRCVIDHCAKPVMTGEEFGAWAAGMTAIAHQTQAYCKLSGLVTEVGPGWTLTQLRPYFDHVLDAFGAERVIWGSDWPVCTLAASYVEWFGATGDLLTQCSPVNRAAILGGNAVRFYRLGDER